MFTVNLSLGDSKTANRKLSSLAYKESITDASRGGQTFLPGGHMRHPVGLQRAALKKLNLLDNKCKSNLLLHETEAYNCIILYTQVTVKTELNVHS